MARHPCGPPGSIPPAAFQKNEPCKKDIVLLNPFPILNKNQIPKEKVKKNRFALDKMLGGP
jgi:hypothetical protein